MVAGVIIGTSVACLATLVLPWPPAAILIGMVAGGLVAAYRSKR